MNEEHQKIEQYAKDVLSLAKDMILMRFRHLDVALAKLQIEYDAKQLLKQYLDEPDYAVRLLLHVLFHKLYFHAVRSERLNQSYWYLACDIAVEHAVLKLRKNAWCLKRDVEQEKVFNELADHVTAFTAETLYWYLEQEAPDGERLEAFKQLFAFDLHDVWTRQTREENVEKEKQWMDIRMQLRTERSFHMNCEAIAECLPPMPPAQERKRLDYKIVLQHFMSIGEVNQSSEEEFDLIYYTYGMTTYGNLPLVEALETREERRVRELVLAIDTSASCKGERLTAFLRHTCALLRQRENFFQTVNLHLVQCDSQVRSVEQFHDLQKFENWIDKGKLQGFGATDFCPVFEYVDRQRKQGMFHGVMGLIYFTDGYGRYPQKLPDYEVVFVLPEEMKTEQVVPDWAVTVVWGDKDEY